ncbi:MAG: S46 family peptidase [Prevotella sp.]|nr:S46 family peptidase [Prevotella sp.]
MIRKTILLLTCVVASFQAKADEGMWTLYNLPPQVYEIMQNEGCTMPYNDLYYGDNALKNAVVNFSGFCTGVVVSPNGLVFTNHHCGFEAIRSHSTVEHDYMLNGFYAKSYEEELPNENMFVSFMIDQRDITDMLKAKGFEDLSTFGQEEFIDSLTQVMTDSVKRIDESLHVSIDPFFEGNRFYATTYQDFTDLRLVFAIPKSMGKFGGETDNWMWPRQTCDFSVFRIYADPKTNGPAAYSENNVPYHPKRWAQVSMQGYKAGDFAMTIGYPGSTQRYRSSYGIQEIRDVENAVRAQVRGVKQDVMIKHMRASEAVRIMYDSKYAESSNYWKNAIGMNKCIDSIGLIAQKAAYEEKIRQWVDKTGYLKDKLDLDTLKSLYAQNKMPNFVVNNIYESFFTTSELFTRFLKTLTGKEALGPEDNPEEQYYIFEDNSDKWDKALDKEVLAAMLKNYAEQVDEEYWPDFYEEIKTKYNNDYAAYVDYLYDNSLLMKDGTKIYFNKEEFEKDPGVAFGRNIYSKVIGLYLGLMLRSSQIDEQERYLCDAIIRMEQDQPHYSDANFTMRLSYGQVGEYMLNGMGSGYYTTAESIVAKMDKASENVEYEAEPIMRQLLSAKDFGPYTDRTTGKMQLCFLTNNDITGGNSGSPMFNGKGELIGLAFDGNWDSLSSDIFFDKQLARCIGVDIRFVLFMMDRWGHADRLLKEINAQ